MDAKGLPRARHERGRRSVVIILIPDTAPYPLAAMVILHHGTTSLSIQRDRSFRH